MIKEIKLIVSNRLPTDLVARGLTPDQIGKVMQWLGAQTEPVMDRSRIETDLRSLGFSQEEVNGILVSLVKESARPQVGYYLVATLLILFLMLFALAGCFRWMRG